MADLPGGIRTLGSSIHTGDPRATDDFYATPPRATHLLTELECFTNPIWEPACGKGHISEPLKSYGYEVYSTDLIDRGYGDGVLDFLAYTGQSIEGAWPGDIITNPPFTLAVPFVKRALRYVKDGGKVAMFLRTLFLESQDRFALFRVAPPRVVYVSVLRFVCAKNGDFKKIHQDGLTSGAMAYSWFVWEKGFQGDPVIKWFNTGKVRDQQIGIMDP